MLGPRCRSIRAAHSLAGWRGGLLHRSPARRTRCRLKPVLRAWLRAAPHSLRGPPPDHAGIYFPAANRPSQVATAGPVLHIAAILSSVMVMQPAFSIWLRRVVPLLLALAAGGPAGAYLFTNYIDFNSDPVAAGLYATPPGSSAKWRPAGGVNPDDGTGGAGNGYLSLTDAAAGQWSAVFFRSLDDRLMVNRVALEAQLRIGGGTDQPGEGFSINFASIGDPLLINGSGNGWAGLDDVPGADRGGAGLPEEGATTGLAIGFDTWAGGSVSGVAEVAGISVRVDNELIAQFPIPLAFGFWIDPRQPAATNIITMNPGPFQNVPTTHSNYLHSLQTGALNPLRDDTQAETNPSLAAWADLRWERFRAEVDDLARLHLWWKGQRLTPGEGIQTRLSPLAGRVILGTRNSARSQVVHIDNLKIVTQPNDWRPIAIGSVAADAFSLVVRDFDGCVFDPAATTNLSVILDGMEIGDRMTRVKSEGITTLEYRPDQPLPSSPRPVLTATVFSVGGESFRLRRELAVPVLPEINPDWALRGEPGISGLLVRTSQLPFERYPGSPNSIARLEHQASGGYVGLAGSPQPNLAITGDRPTRLDMLNWRNGDEPWSEYFSSSAPAGSARVPNQPVPGIPGPNSSNVVTVITAHLELDSGIHRMGVNAIGPVAVSATPALGDAMGQQLNVSEASPVEFEFIVRVRGWYPFRLLAGSVANDAGLEWYAVDRRGGGRRLINQQDGGRLLAGAIAARAPVRGPVVESVSPAPATTIRIDDARRWSFVIRDQEIAVTRRCFEFTINGLWLPTTVHPLADGVEVAADVGFDLSGSERVYELVYYDEQGQRLSFRGNNTVNLLGAREQFVIEAEDFDFAGGKSESAASVMPYVGGSLLPQAEVTSASPARWIRIDDCGGGPPLMRFFGQLEAAERVDGPYLPLLGAGSPWPIERSGAARFFRVR